jgi:Sulfotransferase family
MGIRTRQLELMAKALAATMPGLSPQPRNPYFFIGCGRSGTTLLARLLSRHPQIAAYPYEANELWHPGSVPWNRTLPEALPIWLDPHAFTASSLARRTSKDDRRLMATFGIYQRLVSGKCFLNKSVLVTFMVHKIRELLPDSRFLHVCRDGRAVALSAARKEAQRIEHFPQPYESRGIRWPIEDLIDRFALYWQAHVLEIEALKRQRTLVESVDLHELTYEDLCADPAHELRRIAAFMRIDPSEFPQVPPELVSSMNYKYREDLDEQTLARLSDLIRRGLELKGYQRSPTANLAHARRP